VDETLLTQLEAAIHSGNGAPQIIVLSLGRLRTLARRMLDRHAALRRLIDTDDLLQNAAIRMHRALACIHVQSPRHAMGLAVMQLKRELVDLVRSQRRTGMETLTPDGVSDLDQTQLEESLQSWSDFHAAVEALPKPQREAVHFLWYLELSQEQAAKLLGITDRTLRRHWAAAQETLRRRLDAKDFTGEQ
jgi:RNA polymerase sigma factor (sigma-70 family)